MINLTLGHNSEQRKQTPLLRACIGYFLAALAGVARHSVRSNAKHNPGEPVHWARGKSMDHDECIFRHSSDIADIVAWLERNPEHPDRAAVIDMYETEVDARAWRSLAASQEFYETYRGAPPSPSSRLTAPWPLEPINRAELNGIEFPKKPLPQIVDGTPHGRAWAIVDGDGNLLSLHDEFSVAEDELRRVLGFPGPINTPAEAAELVRAQGTVRLVGMVPEFAAPFLAASLADEDGPGAEDGPDFEGWLERSGLDAVKVQPFVECPSERGHGVDEPVATLPGEAFERCGHASRTKRVCVKEAGHCGGHEDDACVWYEGS